MIALTEEQFLIAKAVGTARHESAEASGRRPDFRDGTEKQHHIDGAGAEMAFILFANSELGFSLSRTLTIDGYMRVADAGDKFEIRSTRNSRYVGKIKLKDPPNRIVIFSLQSSDRVYDFVGWINSSEGKRSEWLADPGGRNKPAYWVPKENMRPIGELKNVVGNRTQG